MKRKLTPKTVEHLKAEGRRRLEVWDTTLPGFGIRVYQTRRKVWFVIARVRGRQRRFTIGTYPVLALGDARTKARKILRDAQTGIYDESPPPESITLGAAVALFVTLYAKPKNRGWRETERILGKFARSTIAVSTRYVAPRLSACWTHWLRTARRIAPIAPSPRSRSC